MRYIEKNHGNILALQSVDFLSIFTKDHTDDESYFYAFNFIKGAMGAVHDPLVLYWLSSVWVFLSVAYMRYRKCN